MKTVEEVKELMEYYQNGSAKQSVDNCIIALMEDPDLEGHIYHNDFSGKINILGEVPWTRTSLELTESDRHHIVHILESRYELYSEKKLDHALAIVAEKKRYHPIKEFLEALVWDGEERIRRALPHFFGVEETELSAASMTLFMMGALERLYKPGCKFDIMFCLVGLTQGAGKSTFFRFLALKDEWFCDDIRRVDDEKIVEKLKNHWIIELAEMIPSISTDRNEYLKACLSRQKDIYREPYARYPEEYLRQCVFAGTTNKKQFLPEDRSGNRRTIPIEVFPEKAEVHILDNETDSRHFIEQMWAEAMVIYRSGNYTLTLPKHLEKQLEEYQAEFTPEDFDSISVEEFLDTTTQEYVCTRMILDEVFHIPEYDKKTMRGMAISINEILSKKGDWELCKSNHNFMKYGPQRSYQRKNKGPLASEGFISLPETARIPFTD